MLTLADGTENSSLAEVEVTNNGFGKKSLITVTPATGYVVKSITVNGEDITATLNAGTYSYTTIKDKKVAIIPIGQRT